MQVQLLEHQKQHFGWARDLLAGYYGYIDTSVTGAGKTHMALALAQHYGLSLFVVAPVTLQDMWNKEAARYGIHVTRIISYDSLRGMRNAELKHPYLKRLDTQVPYKDGFTYTTEFQVTDTFRLAVQNGVLVVIDEFQKIKNDSAQALAAMSLLKPLLQGGKSRFALLSATPFDKLDHSIQLLRALGLLTQSTLCTYDRKAAVWEYSGIEQVVAACRAWNPSRTAQLMHNVEFDSKAVKTLAHQLLCEVIMPVISNAMIKPDYEGHILEVKNGFFKIADSRTEALRKAVAELSKLRAYMEEGVSSSQLLAELTKVLYKLESAKVPDFARVARSYLQQKRKVIISVSYLDTIKELHSLLPEALILQGSVKPKDRAALIERFNTSENLLIMNTEVGGMGISLHDTVGDAPRIMLISPNYRMISVIQAAGRVHRVGVKSSSQVFMFYGQGEGLSETKILNSLLEKSQVLNSILTSERVYLPLDYESYTE